jgi:hypothetical protein
MYDILTVFLANSDICVGGAKMIQRIWEIMSRIQMACASTSE